jgi:hypothetical protein
VGDFSLTTRGMQRELVSLLWCVKNQVRQLGIYPWSSSSLSPSSSSNNSVKGCDGVSSSSNHHLWELGTFFQTS